MSRLPRHGSAVHMGERHGKVSRTGHPPAGPIVEVAWEDGELSWHRADELTFDE